MPYSRKVKRARNGSANSVATAAATPLCCLCQPDEPEGAYQSCSPTKNNNHGYLPKTISACTIATAATNTSSQTIYSSANISMMEQEVCPVTGVYSNISDNYYISSKIIGKGHYGIVRECIHRATRQTFAVKSIDKSKIGRLDHLQREIYLLANVNHHGIMKMVDCYEDAECVHIITEKYTGGELFDKIIDNSSSDGCLSERKAVSVIKSLLEAVAYLHENGVVHRDIKPENILFESNHEDATVKLIDFGLSRHHEKGEKPMTNPVGTAYYMSPELLKGKYDKSTDIWSIGVVAYILLCGHPPFNGSSDSEIQDATRRGRLHFQSNGWLSKSDDAMDFVKCLLRRDPRKRFTAREALMHPWIREMMTF
mmetsp:Transcript_15091/g.24546  ORF Transcript_15091/g.24546 Transcript_15091/m.24546 type:complete len:368 (-) Transcript_15091:73-1176(-)